MTPTHAAALAVVRNSLAMLRTAIEGLPDEAADWKPVPDTNSITVLTLHSVTSTRFWLANGSGQLDSLERYRSEERAGSFATTGQTIASLLQRIDAFHDDAASVVAPGDEAALTAHVSWPDDAPQETSQTGAGCLFHAIAHLREHVGQAQLMRDLWFARQG